MRISLKHWLRQRRQPWLKVFYKAFARWKADKMGARHMQFPRLGPHSVVLDIGGFEGNWAAAVHEATGATVHVFEPHPRFAAALAARFAGQGAFVLHDYAIGSAEGTLTLSDDGDASSSFRPSAKVVQGRVAPVGAVLSAEAFPAIDLVKINIEGGEYDLLPALIETGVIARIDMVQVQFHLFGPEDIARREAIRARLAQTHDCDWSYDFVWERWSRKA